MFERKLSIDPSDVAGVMGDISAPSNAITARAGGGQANATLLTGTINRITVAASVGDSVRLPAAKAGSFIFIFNKSANSVDVFPATGDKVNALSVNAAYALATTHGALLACAVDGTWDAIRGA